MSSSNKKGSEREEIQCAASTSTRGCGPRSCLQTSVRLSVVAVRTVSCTLGMAAKPSISALTSRDGQSIGLA